MPEIGLFPLELVLLPTERVPLHVFRRLGEAAEVEVEEPFSESSPTLSFELAARVDFGLELRQEVLELTSERQRLRRLAEIFERAVEAITVEREVRERASGNG